MNYLPLILIASLLMKNGNGFKDLLGSIDLESLSPLLSLTGLDPSALEGIKTLISSNGDFKSLLPLLLKGFTLNQSAPQPVKEQSNNLNPIKDIASAEIIGALGNYFEN